MAVLSSMPSGVGPTLPADVVQKTQALYAECLERLTA